MPISDETLRGKTVVAADGYVVGQVEALQIDLQAWKIEALQLKMRKEAADRMGAGRGILHAAVLVVPTRMVQSVGEAVVLSAQTEELKQLVGVRQRSAA